MRIAIIEDNQPLADGIAKAFKLEGHGVDCLHEGDQADAFLAAEALDLVILDINLPGKSGLDILKSMRQRKQNVPVLLLTARDSMMDKVSGLDFGADDYLTKPFELAELKARARALLRRSERQIVETVKTGLLELDSPARLLRFEGNVLDLPRREYALAEALIQNRGRILSKNQLLEHLYGVGAEAEEAAVELYIHRLRKRIIGSKVEIRTIRGLGYCLQEIQ